MFCVLKRTLNETIRVHRGEARGDVGETVSVIWLNSPYFQRKDVYNIVNI